jgi:hypothetical protein
VTYYICIILEDKIGKAYLQRKRDRYRDIFLIYDPQQGPVVARVANIKRI